MLTRQLVEKYLVGQCRDHMGQAKLSTDLEVTPNPDLNDVLWDALRMMNVYPEDPSLVTDTDLESISLVPALHTAFLLASLVSLKKRVLNYYQSQASQGAIASRIEFGDRAKRLKVEIQDNLNELSQEWRYSYRSVGDRVSCNTNVPDAIGIRYHP